MTNKPIRIAMILRTHGIEYDDRIRKEMLTIMKLYPNVSFHIFAAITNKPDLQGEYTSDYGVDYTVPLLKSRSKYKPGTHVIAKAWDFYKTIKPLVKDYDALWCADVDPFLFIALSRKPKIWDLHELPQEFLGSNLKKRLLKFLMKRCKAVIHANPERIEYLDSVNALSNKDKQFVIRNYPSFNEADKNTDEKYEEFVRWKGESPCVYLQGATDKPRCDEESVKGILDVEGLRAVVVGRFNEQTKERLTEKYGEELRRRVFFTGMVRQQMTPHYIKQCVVSLVLYRCDRPNNIYCEANRLYQSIINNCPVVVGCNPPMKQLVETHHFGVVLPSDGGNVQDISNGLREALDKRDDILISIKNNKDKILWDSQESEFKKVLKTIEI